MCRTSSRPSAGRCPTSASRGSTAATDLAADVEFVVETYEPRVQLSDSDLKALTAQTGDFELRASIDNIT